MPFNWADWLIIAVTAFSMLISVIRGFVREALSLATWIAAFLVARIFAADLGMLLEDYIPTPSIRMLASFGLLFVATLIAGSIVNFLIGQLVKLTGLSGTDRVLGMVFGFARGVVLFVVAVALLKLTPTPQDPWWRESVLIPHLEVLENWSRETFGDLIPRPQGETDNPDPAPAGSTPSKQGQG